MYFKQIGDKTKYSFIDARCIGRACFAPGMFQHRSPLAGGGSMNTSSPDSPTCMTRAYRGCPHGPIGERTVPCDYINHDAVPLTCPTCAGTGQIHLVGLPIYSEELAKERKARGWKKAK
jgi:hypothetical protein